MTQPGDLKEAIRLYQAGQVEASRQLLHAQLLHEPDIVNKLLWLAKVSSEEREAVAAAELALALQPDNEVAKRGVAAVQQRVLDPALKPAPLDVSRITGLTLAQARTVNWPYRGINRPIGVLLDEKAIQLKDLGWAIENAYDGQSKRAATTMLLLNLLGEGLKDPLPPMKVLDAGSFAARNERIALLGTGGLLSVIILSIFILVAIVAAALFLWLTASPLSRSLNVISCLAVILLVPIVFALMELSERFLDIAENYRAGVKGENAFADTLRASLTSPWALFRNVEWPERRWGDTDAILVGPGGVWAFEVKAYSSDIRVRGEKWQYKTRWGWRNLSKSPAKQARRNAMNVKDYLDLHGVRINWVNSVVIWAGEEEKLSIEDPATPVWTLSKLPEHLEVLWQSEKLSQQQIDGCAAILTEVIEKDRAKRAAA